MSEKVKMSNEEFDLIIRQNANTGRNLPFENIVFTDTLFINTHGEEISLQFENCDFNGITIRDESYLNSLSFKNCDLKSINFISSTTGDVEFWGCKINSLSCRNSTIESLQVYDDNKIFSFKVIDSKLRCIWVLRSVVKMSFALIRSRVNYTVLKLSSINEISFQDNNIKDYVQIEFIENCKILRITNDDHSHLRINSSSFSEIGIHGVTFSKSIDMKGLEISNNLKISNSTFNGLVKFTLKKDDLTNIFGIEEYSIILPKNINITNSNFALGLLFDGLNHKKHIENLNLSFSSTLLGDLTFTNLSIQNINIGGTNSKSNIVFSNINTANFQLLKIANYAYIKVHNLFPLAEMSSFKIIDSMIGKTDFFNVNFNKFALIIKDSQLVDASFTNVKWPNSIPISETSQKNYTPEEHKKQETIYRQLKQVMKKQGDRPRALDFERLEWRAYKKSIIPTWKNLGDRIILWTNQSNNFRENWWKPILLMLTFTAFFYSIMIFCSLKVKQPCIEANFFDCWGFFKAFGEHFKVYLHLLNPIHRVSDYSEGFNGDTWTVFFDTMSRLFNGYFIFQSVRAFRKFIG